MSAALPVVRFEWTTRANTRNLLERGFDFPFAVGVFASTRLECDACAPELAEPAQLAIGLAEGIALTVLFTTRLGADGAEVRLIHSARQSTPGELHALCAAAATRPSSAVRSREPAAPSADHPAAGGRHRAAPAPRWH